MKGYVIPDRHHVVRYCKPRFVTDGIPDRDAFQLTEEDQGTLSVNWVEYFDYAMLVNTREGREVGVAKVRDKIQLGLGFSGAFAFLNVGVVKEAVEAGGGMSPTVKHDPKGPMPASGSRPARGPDPSHALVYGFPDDDYGIAVELRALVTVDRHNCLYPGRV